ncbi:MAG: tetratricopeptide repeat protein [Bacteroidota bacterium]|nr:tetratricopeptide repeat protein [Bacteroidota bacterium]
MTYRLPHVTTILGAFLLLAGVFSLNGLVPAAQAQSAECNEDDVRMNYSLYYEDYKIESWSTSLPYLKWIIRCAPGFPSNNDRNYERLADVYEGLALTAEAEETQQAYMDSALWVHDIAVDSLTASGIDVDPFDWVFGKARFIQKHNALLPNEQTNVGGLYFESYELDHTRLQNYYVNYIILDMVNKDRKSDAVDFMDRAEVDFADDADVLATIENWRGQLFTSPEERIGFLESQIDKNPEDMELKAELLQLYMDEGIRDMAYELADQVMQDNPNGRLYRTVAKMRLDDGDTDEAIRLYEESLDLEGGADAAREVYFNIGIAHQQEGRLASARAQFRRALQEDASYVQALIAIGDLYQTAVQGCGSFEREDRAVYWLAADYFDRAASRAEEDVYRNQARQRSQQIQRFFPTAEDKFFKNWNPGDRYTIDYGCYSWIGETTTVR